jgi:hypothetical protein
MRAATLILVGLCAGQLTAPAQQPVTPPVTPPVAQDSPVLKDFAKRAADYVKRHKLARSEVHGLKPTTSAEQIEHHEHRLANRIRESRRGVGQGNVFTPEIAAEFRRLMSIAMQGPQADPIRKSLQRDAPVHMKPTRVNQSYPDGVPLPSTPPSLLLNLPPLPPELEYRVIGHALILRDVEANLIVDLIPDAIP